MSTNSGYVSAGGRRIYYEIAGEGPAVLFLHGLTLDTRMWDDQWAPFAECHTVVRCDFRGYGRSDDPAVGEPYSHCDDLAAVLERLGIERVTPVGLSMGGGYAVEFALSHPHLIEKLVVIDSALGGQPFGPDWSARLNHFFELGRTKGIDAAKAYWLVDDLFAGSRPYPEVVARLQQMVADYRGFRLLHGDPHVMVDPAPVTRLHEIGVPALVVMGENDLPEFHDVARVLVDGIPNARLEVIAKAGHMANMDNPEAFNRLVLDFLAEA